MRKMKIFLFICLASLMLGSCSSHPVSSKSQTPPQSDTIKNTAMPDYSSVAVIHQPTATSLLIGDTYYEITSASELANSKGSNLHPEDLHSGDLVSLTASKQTTGHFPQKGILLSLMRHEDEKSLLISQAIHHVLLNQEIGDIMALEIKSVSAQLITLQFRDLADKRKFECIVNIKSMDFQVKEIPYLTSKQNP
ncbi:hypothetical protein [Planococcus shenhongbingii]|uniref:Lipoprotein n=1 Tax=Planococcus shenhongbingii TaxID=3058398 RepID=A0ABT8NAK3_9BACL|nr:hypothetical protein [Planococcus sp. N017]MDN7244923.1 hypothetical protein [Planococcus sp. N017]